MLEITNLTESGENLFLKLRPISDVRKVVLGALEQFTVHDKSCSQGMLAEFEWGKMFPKYNKSSFHIVIDKNRWAKLLTEPI